ncbi:MAG: NAD-dependent epimerase/dehydratase family protein [Balneolaceae bacterium]
MILITGANGQLGSELTETLRVKFGIENVLATDITDPEKSDGLFERLDVMNRPHLEALISKYKVNHIYHLAAILSAKAEKDILHAWDLNMKSLLYVLDIAKEKSIKRVFWPSSIAVFGPDAPSERTPQHAALNPTTVYGISKMAGEQWCAYYHNKFGVDIRSLRYPGLIGYKSLPGGGTTDYAVDIFFKALQNEPFTCFLNRNSRLPMMYMEDAVKATLQLMEASPEKITVHTSYNISGMNFTPEEISNSIKKRLPSFKINYKPDYRQQIADSWPDSIDDTPARNDWGWKASFNLEKMTDHILTHLSERVKKESTF